MCICILLGRETCKTVTVKAITALLVEYEKLKNVSVSLLIVELCCLKTVE